ncbi:beta strand repeat-containing protein [Bradyrhizobium viridifuturi]|uniref:beta strand repeat-containing protein n=1 Tax=Bradyrhizobium viridifuturi TaxID=1654716 RepID=UPI00067F1D58|nr:calcium-binding protein [Bradyrhizobium viridifuturi]
MAVTANLAAGVLSVIGDAADDTITTSRDAAGVIAVDGGAVPIAGGPSTTANTTAINIFGQGGDDTITLDASNGALPPVTLDGGAGNDTAVIQGEDASEVFVIAANGSHVSLNRTSPDPLSVDISTAENLVLHAGGGDDVITAGNGLAALISLTLDGGDGNDTITGGDGDDLLIGGDGNDIVTGGRGNDTALLGNGDDTYIWNPGDGSDTVEGGAGNDTLQFNGANIAEKIDISANGSRVRFTRDVANVTMDLNGIENINFKALGGADQVTVNDLTGTDVRHVTVDLQASGGGGDGAADTVTVDGSGNADQITAALIGGNVVVSGLAADVTIIGPEGANDSLVINASGGDDIINASALPAGQLALTIDAGDGNDTIIGSQGADLILGGDGNDTVTGGRGDDTALLGAGDDTYIWNPGDGSDIVEGQSGTDTLVFNGANISEQFDISANGSRVRLTRDVANITMDLNGVEKIDIHTLGGADTITVNDLSGTDAQQVAIDLSATGGNPDGALDTVIANGSAGADIITVTQSGNDILVNGLAAQILVHGQDATDVLQINGQGGDDQINASGVAAGAIALTINGGAGNDLIIGSAGNDTVIGGQGNDTALLGAGDDTYIWNPGDGSDTVEGQAGADTLQFNGANIAENIDISANGSRVRFTRDVANITMDLNGIEKIAYHALGGADHVTVHDLTGTDVKQVLVDLSATAGSGTGDGAADTVAVEGTNGIDQITVTQSGGTILIDGLPAEVSILGQEAANDSLTINGFGGADNIDASGLGAAAIKLTIDGGAAMMSSPAAPAMI